MGSLEAVARAVKLSTPKLFAAPPGRGAEDILSELAPSDKMPHELPRTELSRCKLGKMAPRICTESRFESRLAQRREKSQARCCAPKSPPNPHRRLSRRHESSAYYTTKYFPRLRKTREIQVLHNALQVMQPRLCLSAQLVESYVHTAAIKYILPNVEVLN